MAKTKNKKTFRWQAHKPLLATALAVAGVFNMAVAVLALGTDAGTAIENTATATYQDDNGTPINATSNTVTINVAEIAGLTAVPTGITDSDGVGSAVEANDTLTYSFEVTNTGNAETDVFIPGIDNIITDRIDFTTPDGGTVEVFDAATGTSLGFVPAAGGNLTTDLVDGVGAAVTVPALPADAAIIVRVTGNVAAGTVAGDNVGVTLGNTPPNDNTTATQNQDFNDAGATNDLSTVDVGPTASNGVREASAEQGVPFAASVRPLALATVLKEASNIERNDTSNTQDDQITYTLGLNVEDTDPSGLFQPASLEGTDITLDGGTQTRILISDAIPVGTELESVATSLPAGWTAVYTTDAAAGNDPLAATWTTAVPSPISTTTRVGFVHNGPLAAGYTETGLDFTVVTTGLDPVTGGTVDNLAQVFGQTAGDTEIVYDESGDSDPNNYDAGNPPDATGTDYPAAGDDGVADPIGDEVDLNNNNTGTGPDGEVNQVTVTPTNDDILNGTNPTGPATNPGAVGPTDDNDDFTNLSTAVPAGVATGDTFDPASVTFNNSLTNPATGGFLSNVTIEPIRPQTPGGTTENSAESADANATTGQYGTNTDIPDGTEVTISDGVNSATYTYNSATGFTINGGDTPVNVGDVFPGDVVEYTVEVNLPTVSPLDAVSIPVIAFPDDAPGTATAGFSGEVTNNITIDRLYTGFMDLTKEARVLAADGTERLPFAATFPTDEIAPGEFIEYRVSYRNISEVATGDNIGLNANNFVLTEDGTLDLSTLNPANTNINNWASFTTHQQNTVATTGSVDYVDITGPTVTADPASGEKVDVYVNNVGTVSPDGDLLPDGSLTFRRIVD